MKNKLIISLLSLAALLPAGGHAQGAVNYIDSINGQTAAGNNALGTGNSPGDNVAVNMAFTTGNNAGGYTFNSVAVLLAATTGSPGAGGFVMIQPAARQFTVNSATALGGATLNGNGSPTTAGTYSYEPYSGHGFTLAADTTYYLFFENVAPLDDIEWSYATSVTSAATTGGWSIGGTSNFGGANPVHGIPMFQINATPIVATPEPGTLALAALGGVGGLLAYRRRK